MISYIKGNVLVSESGTMVVETGGIGYQITTPDNADYFMIKESDEVQLWTYLSVTQDAVNLYGFLTRQELEMFKMLITVSGIGPKGAVGILSKLSVTDVKMAIISDDAAAISSAPGVGKKTAGKVILELKDKIDKNSLLAGMVVSIDDRNETIDSDAAKEAILALTSLGYSRAESSRAVRAAAVSDDLSVEEILRLALREL